MKFIKALFNLVKDLVIFAGRGVYDYTVSPIFEMFSIREKGIFGIIFTSIRTWVRVVYILSLFGIGSPASLAFALKWLTVELYIYGITFCIVAGFVIIAALLSGYDGSLDDNLNKWQEKMEKKFRHDDAANDGFKFDTNEFNERMAEMHESFARNGYGTGGAAPAAPAA